MAEFLTTSDVRNLHAARSELYKIVKGAGRDFKHYVNLGVANGCLRAEEIREELWKCLGMGIDWSACPVIEGLKLETHCTTPNAAISFIRIASGRMAPLQVHCWRCSGEDRKKGNLSNIGT